MNGDVRQSFQEAIGANGVLYERADLAVYENNTSAFQRSIAGVLLPRSVEQVQALVAVANQHKVPLYPVSTGRNWGMGSRLPVQDGAVVVDLSKMNSIRSVDVSHGVAVIEPGVTQAQLYGHLQSSHVPAVFNVTGSSPDTSIVGNTLERGVGYFSSRADDIVWLEVVLGDGRLVRTGFGHYENAQARDLYRFGLGPDLTGAFMQANFGIVTAIGFKLIPHTGQHMALLAKISDASQFADFIQALANLRKSGVVQTAIHIGNCARTRSAIAPPLLEQLGQGDTPAAREAVDAILDAEGFGPWSAVGGVFGTKGQLTAARREIKSALAGKARVNFLTDAKLDTLMRLAKSLSFIPAMRKRLMVARAVRPLFGLSKGTPTGEPMKSVYWSAGQPIPEGELDPDQGHAGVLYCLPIIPMTGAAAHDAVKRTELICGKHGFVPYITFNMINTGCLEGVINVAFDRSNAAQVTLAHACILELQESFVSDGLLPYRLTIQEMQRFVSADDTFWQVVRELKSVFDPNHIIAPGRYNLV